MLTRYTFILLLILFNLSSTPAICDTIRILPGPLDGCKIQTPWGDYIAVQHGDTVWVGTQEEYDHARLEPIFEKQGFREVKLEGIAPNEHVLISRDRPTVTIGSKDIYDINLNVLFGVGPDKRLHRPKKPKNAEYVVLSWVAGKKTKVRPLIYDRETKKTYTPFDCTGNDVSTYCEFMIPKASLTHKAGIFFTSGKAKPGFLPIQSIAMTDYRGLEITYKQLKKDGISMDPDSAKELGQLHLLDAKIPGSFEQIDLQEGENNVTPANSN
ncbi:hypothetical protein [Geotalea sp. SG265]|uniref:hypothetical protein n=1 Tax=Geotalea sp. SG265 TaxID=2922867 RepID=UPI001FAEFCDA|nr:hypothetical protein [Geotalea sp. SG265]